MIPESQLAVLKGRLSKRAEFIPLAQQLPEEFTQYLPGVIAGLKKRYTTEGCRKMLKQKCIFVVISPIDDPRQNVGILIFGPDSHDYEFGDRYTDGHGGFIVKLKKHGDDNDGGIGIHFCSPRFQHVRREIIEGMGVFDYREGSIMGHTDKIFADPLGLVPQETLSGIPNGTIAVTVTPEFDIQLIKRSQYRKHPVTPVFSAFYPSEPSGAVL